MRRWLRERLWYGLRRQLRRIQRPSLPRRAKLTRTVADELFPESKRCQHCGCWHDVACPRVRRIAFRGDAVATVEFWPERRWFRQGWSRRGLVTPTKKEAMIDGD